MNLRSAAAAVGSLRRHEQLLMICVSTVLVMAGQGVIAPVLPLFARDFGVGAAAVGLTLSFFALARLLLNVPLGALSDRHGRRALLVGGPLVTAVGMFGSGFSQNIEQLLAWRFVAGAGSAMYMTAAMAYLADISTPETRARFIGTNQGALLLGVSIGPAIGGISAQFLGLRAPFFLVGASALVATAYAFWRLPETRVPGQTGEESAATEGRAWLSMVRSVPFLAVSLVTMAIFLTRSAGRSTLVPLLAAARFDMSPGLLGAVFTGMSSVGLVLITPAAVAADRFGRRAVIVPSGLLATAGLMLYASANQLGLFFVASAVFAIGMSLAGPAPAAYAADIAPEDARGLAMGLYRSSGDIGFVFGPPLLGLLADATSYGWALAANAALIAGATLVFRALAPETVRHRSAEPAPMLERKAVPGD